jgi:hypothetical protein
MQPLVARLIFIQLSLPAPVWSRISSFVHEELHLMGQGFSCSVDKGYYKIKSLLIYSINLSPLIHSYHHVMVKLSLSWTKQHATKIRREAEVLSLLF